MIDDACVSSAACVGEADLQAGGAHEQVIGGDVCGSEILLAQRLLLSALAKLNLPSNAYHFCFA